MENYKFEGTEGEWSSGHLINEDHSCDCSFVFSEGHFGSIATINWSKEGGKLEDGDNPLIEEAKANLKLITASPLLLDACIKALEVIEMRNDSGDSDIISTLKSSIEKSL